MSKVVRLAVLAALVATVAACGGTDAEVAGPTWTLTELTGGPLIDGTTIDLTIADDSVSGSSGCNIYMGPATLGDGDITLGPQLAGTMMACAENVMAQERLYLDTLVTVTSYEVSGDTLSLLDSDGTVVATFN